uniref:Uncharacterized protein n=1 Tax=Mastacembelus armatus TaxID=205130 RepID=A0A7N9AZ12_9TELE
FLKGQMLLVSALPLDQKELVDNHSNLLRVADYCESHYLQVSWLFPF